MLHFRLEQEIIVKCLLKIIGSFPLMAKTQHPSTHQHMLSQILLWRLCMGLSGSHVGPTITLLWWSVELGTEYCPLCPSLSSSYSSHCSCPSFIDLLNYKKETIIVINNSQFSKDLRKECTSNSKEILSWMLYRFKVFFFQGVKLFWCLP